MKRKSKFLTFILSFVPGVGHLYLNLPTRGLQLMATFFLAIYLGDLLHTSIFILIIPIIWFYSMFDAMNLVSSGQPLEDKGIGIFDWFNHSNTYTNNKYKILAYALIIIGSFMIIEKIALPVIVALFGQDITSYLQTVIVAALLIAGGIKLLLGNKNSSKEKNGGNIL